MRIEYLPESKRADYTMEILDFEQEIGHELIVEEREIEPCFCALFEHAEIEGGVTLISMYGTGDNVNEAIIDYCNGISNKNLVFGASTDKRKTFHVPQLIHTKFIEEKK